MYASVLTDHAEEDQQRIVGALIAGFLFGGGASIINSPLNLMSIIYSLIGAIILLAIYKLVTRGRSGRSYERERPLDRRALHFFMIAAMVKIMAGSPAGRRLSSTAEQLCKLGRGLG